MADDLQDRIAKLEERVDKALEELGLTDLDTDVLRALRASKGDLEAVYLSCYEDIGEGDSEAFVGVVNPLFADVVRSAANQFARESDGIAGGGLTCKSS